MCPLCPHSGTPPGRWYNFGCSKVVRRKYAHVPATRPGQVCRHGLGHFLFCHVPQRNFARAGDRGRFRIPPPAPWQPAPWGGRLNSMRNHDFLTLSLSMKLLVIMLAIHNANATQTQTQRSATQRNSLRWLRVAGLGPATRWTLRAFLPACEAYSS